MVNAPLIATFHSFCVRFLKEEIKLLGYPLDFAIIDAFEQFIKWMQKENPQTQNAVIAKLQEMGLAGKISYNHNTNSTKFIF